MKLYHVKVQLTVQAPLMSRGLGALPFGLDVKMHRDGSDRPAFPDTLIQGRLAQGWFSFFGDLAPQDFESLTGFPPLPNHLLRWFLWQGQRCPKTTSPNPDKCPFWARAEWQDWFKKKLGETYAEPDNWAPRQRPYWADFDWPAITPAQFLDPLFQVKLEDHSHAPEQGAYAVIESCFPPGSDVEMEGGFRCFAANEEEAKAFAFWLGQGLAPNRELGGITSVGYGELKRVTTQLEPRQEPQPLPLGNGASCTLRLHLDRPFCFPSFVRPSDNRFESRDFIPGSAIKAVVATRLLQQDPQRSRAALWSAFDALRVRHVQAASRDERQPLRPRAVPLSWVYVEARNRFLDLAHVDNLDLHSPEEIYSSSVNWKHQVRNWAKRLCGQPERLRRTLRLHPSIDPERLTVQEGMLHTQDCVVPSDSRWLTELVLPEGVDAGGKQELWEALGRILSDDIGPLGQTDAFAKAEVVSVPEIPPPDDCFSQGFAVVVLQSEALLLTEPWGFPATGGEEAYFQALQAAWADLSIGALELVRHFSSLRGMGGRYLQGWFWNKDKASQGAYRPVLLSTEGSTFVLKPIPGKEGEAAILLKRWLREGLPQRTEARGGDAWDSNPFLAANGYGEISLNFEVPEEVDHA